MSNSCIYRNISIVASENQWHLKCVHHSFNTSWFPVSVASRQVHFNGRKVRIQFKEAMTQNLGEIFAHKTCSGKFLAQKNSFVQWRPSSWKNHENWGFHLIKTTSYHEPGTGNRRQRSNNFTRSMANISPIWSVSSSTNGCWIKLQHTTHS